MFHSVDNSLNIFTLSKGIQRYYYEQIMIDNEIIWVFCRVTDSKKIIVSYHRQSDHPCIRMTFLADNLLKTYTAYRIKGILLEEYKRMLLSYFTIGHHLLQQYTKQIQWSRLTIMHTIFFCTIYMSIRT